MGCLSPHGAVVADVGMGEWRDTVHLTISNDDTLLRRTVNLILRYDTYFKSDTLPLELIFRSPDSLRLTECVTFRIPRKHEPASRTHEVEIPYRTGVVLGRRGNYMLSVVPREPVEGILTVGINIR